LIPSYEPPFTQVYESLVWWKVKALGEA